MTLPRGSDTWLAFLQWSPGSTASSTSRAAMVGLAGRGGDTGGAAQTSEVRSQVLRGGISPCSFKVREVSNLSSSYLAGSKDKYFLWPAMLEPDLLHGLVLCWVFTMACCGAVTTGGQLAAGSAAPLTPGRDRFRSQVCRPGKVIQQAGMPGQTGRNIAFVHYSY